jgi:hypothetical protein
MFAENKTLEVLDISGEHAHLEVARFGIGLNHALTGLKKNTALKVLRIEYQNSDSKAQAPLRPSWKKKHSCKKSTAKTTTSTCKASPSSSTASSKTLLLHLPSMDRDRAESLHTVQREIENIRNHPPRIIRPRLSQVDRLCVARWARRWVE